MSAKTIWPIRQLRADFHAGHISKAEAHLADTIADLLVESGKYPHREWQPYAFLMARMILLLCRAQNPVGPRSPGGVLLWARNSRRSQGRDDSSIAHSITTRAA
jgi:hypothetical protein